MNASLSTGKSYIPFGYKLMLSYAAFIMIPVLLVGYAANSIFVGSVREQTRTAIQGTLRQMSDNIAYQLGDIRRISDMLYLDNALADILYNYDEGFITYQNTRSYIIPRLETMLNATGNKVWISLYLHNDRFKEIYNDYGGLDPLLSNKRLFDIYHIGRIGDKAWYWNYPEERFGETYQWMQIEDDIAHHRISFLRRILNYSRYEPSEIAFLRISIHLSDLLQSLDYRKIGDGSTLYITNESDRIISLSGQTPLAEGDRLDPAPLDKHLLIEQPFPGDTGWTIKALVSNSIIEKNSAKVHRLTIFVCLASFVTFALAAIFVSRYFSRRVQKIVSVADSFQEGDFHKRINFKGNDEFTQIGSALNEMGQNIGSLIREVYVKDVQKKEAELVSLQAQINPHFLYNTLSSISRLAKFGEVDKLHRMVLDLATFYRLSLSDGKSFIPVRQELEQARAYVDIQKIKNGELMDVLYDIDPAIAPYSMIKLTLQPFIENVLEHGWRGDRITIRLTGRLEQGNLVFQIIDDGVGFRAETIRRIFAADETSKAGYGIRNVDQRIKLHYGQAFGVSIGSRPGIGATVRVVFPATRGAGREA